MEIYFQGDTRHSRFLANFLVIKKQYRLILRIMVPAWTKQCKEPKIYSRLHLGSTFPFTCIADRISTAFTIWAFCSSIHPIQKLQHVSEHKMKRKHANKRSTKNMKFHANLFFNLWFPSSITLCSEKGYQFQLERSLTCITSKFHSKQYKKLICQYISFESLRRNKTYQYHVNQATISHIITSIFQLFVGVVLTKY